MNNVINLFPKICEVEIVTESQASAEDLIAYWKERNQLISDDFHKSSVFQKQETLDIVLNINNELYELVLDLKSKLKLKGEAV